MAKDKRQMTVHQALIWAFRSECVQLDLPDRRDPEDRGGGFGMEYVLIQRMKIGVTIDTSIGHSSPHVDAETIAAIVVNLRRDLGGAGMAIRVAELSRSGLIPDWMPDAEPRIEPVAWVQRNGTGQLAKSEVVAAYYEEYTAPHPKNDQRTIKRRRRVEIEYTPCRWSPSRSQIANVRDGYSSWWLALDEIRQNLMAVKVLRDIEIIDGMPPRKPWVR